MNQQRENELLKKHKTFFKLKGNDNYPIFEGIHCDDGWADLIDETVSKVLELCKEKKAKCSVQVVQVKQKMGELRIYFNTKPANAKLNESIGKIEIEAAEKSLKVCELCSDSAKLRTFNKGTLKTLCWKCNFRRILRKITSWVTWG